MVELMELEPEEAIVDLKDFRDAVQGWTNIENRLKAKTIEVAEYAIMLAEQGAGI